MGLMDKALDRGLDRAMDKLEERFGELKAELNDLDKLVGTMVEEQRKTNTLLEQLIQKIGG